MSMGGKRKRTINIDGLVRKKLSSKWAPHKTAICYDSMLTGCVIDSRLVISLISSLSLSSQPK